MAGQDRNEASAPERASEQTDRALPQRRTESQTTAEAVLLDLLLSGKASDLSLTGCGEAGSVQACLQQVTPLWKREPDNVYVQDLVRQSLVGSGRFAEALALLERAVVRSPDDAGPALDYANAMSEVGNGAAAKGLGADALAEIRRHLESDRAGRARRVHPAPAQESDPDDGSRAHPAL